jgi:hypothetical protein
MPQHTPTTAELVAAIDSRIDVLLAQPEMYGGIQGIESVVLSFLQIRSFARGQYGIGCMAISSIFADLDGKVAMLKAYVDVVRSQDATVGSSNTDCPTYDELLREARERYEPGKGPWSKEDDLDQVDLVKFEEMSLQYAMLSDERGLLSGCVRRLVDEVRRARNYPTTPVYVYKESDLLERRYRLIDRLKEPEQ